MKKLCVAATGVMVCMTIAYVFFRCVNFCHIPTWRLLFSIFCHIAGLVLQFQLSWDIAKNDSRISYGFRTEVFQIVCVCVLLSFILLSDKVV